MFNGQRWRPALGALTLTAMLWVLVAGIWMVRQGPPIPEHVTPLAEHHVTV